MFSVKGADGYTLEVIVPDTDIDEREGVMTVRVVVLGARTITRG